MGVIETLLNSNFSTVASFIVAAIALAFIWYVALPKIAELSEVKSQLAEAQSQASQRDNAQVDIAAVATELSVAMATIQTSLEAMQVDSRRRSTDVVANHDAMLTNIAEVRHQVSTLAQHVLNLSSAVNTAIHREAPPRSRNEGPPPHGFKGLR